MILKQKTQNLATFVRNMMKMLRNNVLKNTFGLMLLGIILTKVFVFSFSCFSSRDAFAIEKSSEESKDKEENALNKIKIKEFLYQFPDMSHHSLIWTNLLPPNSGFHTQPLGTSPIKTVLTPPPNQAA